MEQMQPTVLIHVPQPAGECPGLLKSDFAFINVEN